MFRRLRERIAEEATRFPVGQLGNNPVRTFPENDSRTSEVNSTEDLITLSENSSVIVPHTSSQQFSIGDDDDGSFSEQSTPQKLPQNNQSATPESLKNIPDHQSTPDGLDHEFRPRKRLSYVPQSDIESEREDPPTLNLDSISKEQLMAIIQSLKARSYKYKNKYAEVVKNFKELREDKIKIENALTEYQDKGLRRIGELREQCLLEQKAKAHLEENLRLLLEEKDSRISVLETQINLLKEGKLDISKSSLDDCDILNSDAGSGDTKSEDSIISLSSDTSVLQEQTERLKHQINQDKKTITAQKNQISLLKKQNENLSAELETKVKKLNELEDEQIRLKTEHESVLQSMQSRLEELEKQQEESIMSMAETKKYMHEELELKEKQLVKSEEEAKYYQSQFEQEKNSISEIKKQHEEQVNEFLRQLEVTEKTLEDEKQSLLQELAQGKTAAVNLMQQECARKIAAVEEQWKTKLQELQSSYDKNSDLQVKELSESLKHSTEKVKESEKRIHELESVISKLEKENASLKNSVEKLESKNLETSHEESVKVMKDKLQNAEENYKIQIDEIKKKLLNLEKERNSLKSENESLKQCENKYNELIKSEENIRKNLQLKENELKLLKEKFEVSGKEQCEKVHSLQENMKDKENMVLKLKTSIESITKDNQQKCEELSKKIKWLEQEREQLMLQAQERVSSTELKYREEVKCLEEKCDKLLLENSEIEKLKNHIDCLNKQLDESLVLAQSNQAASNKEILNLKEQLAKAEKKISEAEVSKKNSESLLLTELEKLQQEKELLLQKSNNLEKLKSEKEELNEKLKNMAQQVNKISELEAETMLLKKKNDKLVKENTHLSTLESDCASLKEKCRLFEYNELSMKEKRESLVAENEKLASEISSLINEKELLLRENTKLSDHINQLQLCNTNPDSASNGSHIDALKKEYEDAIKAKDEDMIAKLKELVKDFSKQMEIKDRDSEHTISELTEKSLHLEETLRNEYEREIASLRQDLFEKNGALSDMRDSYEEALKERSNKLKELEVALKNVQKDSSSLSEPLQNPVESSDWDDTWAVPDEAAENSSPVRDANTCNEHLIEIETLQEELSKCNSEIKELKLLLRLSPPDDVDSNRNRRDSLQSLPEPTEFEYLKNIVYEYMMGKEPVTLAKVIAAVLKFSDSQTQQVVKREETKHPPK